MSATGRGERGGEGADYFPTPAWCVDWLLRGASLPGGYWLEPSAGDGAIINAVNARRGDVTWGAVEIRPACMEALQRAGPLVIWCGPDTGDFRSFGLRAGVVPFAVVCGNPPYADAAEHVARALTCAPIVAFLLRLNFLGSAKRRDFWRRHPADIYVLSERPSFDGEGTDATEYAWFVWGQCGAGPGRVQVLGPPETLPLLAPERTTRRASRTEGGVHMGKYRKKPVVIDAEQYSGPESIPANSAGTPAGPAGIVWDTMEDGVHRWPGRLVPTIPTLEGKHLVSPGDWVITGVKGEKYPCKPDIFEATYEAVDVHAEPTPKVTLAGCVAPGTEHGVIKRNAPWGTLGDTDVPHDSID